MTGKNLFLKKREVNTKRILWYTQNMKITIVCVGKIKEKFYRDAVEEYKKRLGRYCKMQIVEVADEKTPDKASEALENQIKEKEGNRILSHISDSDYVIALAINGKERDSVELAEHIRDLGYMPEQVQDFYPTPSTISTCMYYTGVDPRTMQPVYVPKNPHEKAMQRALIQYRDPKNYDLVMEALKKAHRMDLVGFDKHCLIRPRKFEGRSQQKVPGQKTQNQKSSGKPGRNDRGKNKNEHSRRNTVQSDRQNSRQNTGTDRSRQKKKSIRNVHKKK